jgi:probable addiction module antidote protein
MRARKAKVSPSIPFESILDQHLKSANQKEITAYLNSCLDDDGDDMETFFLVLEDIARARGIQSLAEKTGKARDTFYKMFAGKNPTVGTLRSLLSGLDMDIQIVIKKP